MTDAVGDGSDGLGACVWADREGLNPGRAGISKTQEEKKDKVTENDTKNLFHV